MHRVCYNLNCVSVMCNAEGKKDEKEKDRQFIY
jgi:hypothetical protein